MAVSNWLSPVFLVAFLTLMSRSSSQGVCPSGWIHLLSSCFKFSTNALNWNAAKSACEAEALGSNLVSIHSEAEHQAVISITPNVNQFTWIGLHRNPDDKSQWLWVDGSPVTYTNWFPNQPSHLSEECTHIMTLSHYGLQWGDRSCSLAFPFVCKISDIDECAVSNGGCSHKCVNTVGGYKCECPDPELSLAKDNKTCEAPRLGVEVQCNRDNMTIIIPKSRLPGINREHLRLLDTTCKAEENSTHISLTTPLTGCKTTRNHTSAGIVYSNTVLEISVTDEANVARAHEQEIQFSCIYSKYGVVSSVGWQPSNRKLVSIEEDQGNFTLSLNMYHNNSFVSPYTKDDFPVAVELGTRQFFEVSVTSSDKQLSIIAHQCYATPTEDGKSPYKYEFIAEGCPNDETVEYHSAPSVSAQRFSLETFRFIGDYSRVYIYCHVIVCNGTDPESECTKECSSPSGRARRAVEDHVTKVYSIAQGPLYLAREEQEQTIESGLDNGGSSPSFLMALLVVCVACLAGNLADFF